ncbi:toxin glutamine deamidase domain-containing protein [Streptomyces sp. NRRL S-646]|uniref:toxin glutamine deamidase domain-containing protein n=1 Tax=Streptomyces sp. NRRL S-646 TaxID=1463917 RepID=UPI00133148D4|nr:toxin glutamine deamidase domain-containing protein [Streptomyces sp. NRRL S-646]
MMLPDELEWVLEMLGYNWPTADEDKLKDSAKLWRKFGDDVTELHTTANLSAGQVVAHNAGESIDAFTKTYKKFDGGGGDGYLGNAAQAAYLIANVMEACAYIVELAKWAVIAQLIALAIEIAAAQAAAPFTFGLSEVGALGATQVTRLIVRRLLDELKEALLNAIVEAMKEPAISMIEAIITDLIRQTVNVGFGAQEGYDLGATVKAGADSAWDAIKQTPQTLAEGVRDSLGEKAGHRAHHAIDSRIDGHGGGSEGGHGDGDGDSDSSDGDGDSNASDGDRGSNSSDGEGSSDSSSDSSSSSSSDSSSSSSDSSSHSNGSDSSGSDSSASTRAGSNTGVNIGGGISADTGGNGIGAPDLGAGPGSDSGSGSDSGAGADSGASRPTLSHSGPTLSDFDDPSPSGASSGGSDSGGASDGPSASGPSHSGGGSPVSGIASPTVHSVSASAPSGGTSPSPSTGGHGGISTNIDSLAASTPTHTNAAPTPSPTTGDPSSSGGGGGRADGGSGMPTSPVAPSTAGGMGGGSHHSGGTSGSSTSSGGSPSSPTPNSAAARTTSATTSGTTSPTGSGPASTPSPTSPSTPRSTTTASASATADGRVAGGAGIRVSGTGDGRVPGTPDGRTPGPSDGRTPGTPDGRIPTQRTPGSSTPGDGTTPRSTPGDGTTSRDTPGTRPGDGTTPRNTTPGDGTTPRNTPGTRPGDSTTPRSTTDPTGSTRTNIPGQNSNTGTSNQNPSSTPRTTSPSTGTSTSTPSTSTGSGSDRNSTPSDGTSNSSTPSGRTSSSGNSPTTQGTPGTSGTQNQPGSNTGTGSTPNRPSQPAGGTPNTPNTPNAPQQPAAHPNGPSQNTAPNNPQQQQHQVTPVPVHTPIRVPGASASPSHASGSATPHAPGSPQATPGDPSHQQHPQQDSLQDIRSDLDHYPGGLTEPDPADQQALDNAVPRNEDGTPQRHPDPFGNWSQLQNDGGSTVPGRSNNCADCSRSFLETWYGNPQVSAPRTLDLDEHGKPNLWSPEHNANDNQIRWAGAAHTYAGPGNNPDTANNIASTLQQAGPGSAAIVQVDWPGGGGHAFNVVNHNGNIVWVDTQSGEVSHAPLHIDQATHVWHIPLDANGHPIDTSQPHTQDSESHDDATQAETNDASQPENSESNEQPENGQNAQNDVSGDTPKQGDDTESGDNSPKSADQATPDASNNADPTKPSTAEPNTSPDPKNTAPDPTVGERANENGGLEGESDSPSERDSTHDGHKPSQDTPEGRQPSPDDSNTGRQQQPEQSRETPSAQNRPTPAETPTNPHQQSHQNEATHPDEQSHIPDKASEQPTTTQSPSRTDDSPEPRQSPAHLAPDPADNGTPGSSTTPTRPEAGTPHDPRTNPETDTTDRGDRRLPADPAGQQQHGKDSDGKESDDGDGSGAKEKKAGFEPHPDDSHPRLEREPGDSTTLRSGLPPDDAQVRVRETNPVFRLQHDEVDHQLQEWAKNGQLAHVLRVASGQDQDPNTSPDRPRTFTAEGLNKVLPGFSSLNRGERMLVISTLARLSHSAHEQYGVNSNPMDNGQGSEGVAKHKRIGQPVRALMESFGNPTKHKPDLTQRNFAVVEIQRNDGTVEYVTDSSFPNRKGVTGLHSERHLADWIDDVNKAYKQTGHEYTITSLYTEREPCGDKKGGLKSANCSDLLGKQLAGVPVYYSTTYRADQAVDEQRADLRKQLQEQRRGELGLGPRQPLPKQVKSDIDRQIGNAFPSTPAEKERDQEIKERVNKVRDLWKTIAPSL